jgi:hypothetical protein
LAAVKSGRKIREVGRQFGIHEAGLMKGLKLNLISFPKIEEKQFLLKNTNNSCAIACCEVQTCFVG